MVLRSLATFCAVSVALSLSGLNALASDKSVSIETAPPGAQVEMNGSIACTTPCSVRVPGYYFGQKHTAVSAHGKTPIHVTLTKAGYAPKTVELTEGPIHWVSLSGVHGYDYYVVTSDHFTFQLDANGTAPVKVSPQEPRIAAASSSTTIAVASPSGVSPHQIVKCTESPLVIRGVVTDSNGILLVTVNGSAANMRPQNTQSTEFWSEPLRINPGDTPIAIIASNSAHVETTLDFTLHYAPNVPTPNPHALSMKDIVSLLQGDVPNARIVDLVKEHGLKFALTDDDLNQIRHAGGSEDLIEAIQQATPPM